MRFKAVANRVLLKIVPLKEKVTKGGIITDVGLYAERDRDTGELKTLNTREQQEARQCVGEVLHIGPLAGEGYGDEWIKVGDRVLFVESGSRKVLRPNTDEERLYRFVNDKDIYGLEEVEELEMENRS